MGDNEHTPAVCDKGPVLSVLQEGQKTIFEKLDNITSILSTVAVQNEKIRNLGDRMSEMQGNSIRRDDFLAMKDKLREIESAMKDRLKEIESDAEKTADRIAKIEAQVHVHKKNGLLEQVTSGVLIAVVTAFILGMSAFGLFMVYDHYADFDIFSKTQYTGEHKK